MAKLQHAKTLIDPSLYQQSEFGKVLPFEVIKADMDAYAQVFSEGSEELKKLLLQMWDNNVETLACCTGHLSVPFYYKDSLFGQKRIEAEEYAEHSSSRRYHKVFRDRPGYFSVRLNYENDYARLRAMSDSISELLQNEVPALPSFSVSYGHNDIHNCDFISIHMCEVPSRSQGERFFSSLNQTLCRALNLQAEKNPVLPSLDELKAAAEAWKAAHPWQDVPTRERVIWDKDR